MKENITLSCSRYGEKGAFKGKKVKRTLTPHALKGQKLLAQGNTLGIIAISKSPCKGKSFLIHIRLKIMAKRKVEIPKGSWLDKKGQRWMKVVFDVMIGGG